MAPSIKQELEREKDLIHRAIRKHVSLSPLLKSEKNKVFLLEASCDSIAKQVARWENHAQLPDHHRQVAPQMVAFLNNLNRLKEGESEKRRAVAAPKPWLAAVTKTQTSFNSKSIMFHSKSNLYLFCPTPITSPAVITTG